VASGTSASEAHMVDAMNEKPGRARGQPSEHANATTWRGGPAADPLQVQRSPRLSDS